MDKIWDQVWQSLQKIPEQEYDNKRKKIDVQYNIHQVIRDKFQELETTATEKETIFFKQVLIHCMMKSKEYEINLINVEWIMTLF